MPDPEELFTGFRTQNGEKVYLGDKLIAPFMHSSLVQLDSKTKRFIAGHIGKNRPYYRSYDLEDLLKHSNLRVVHNTILFPSAEIGDTIKVSVDNLPKDTLALHELARVIAVGEWEIKAKALIEPERKVLLQYGQFLESWRIEEITWV